MLLCLCAARAPVFERKEVAEAITCGTRSVGRRGNGTRPSSSRSFAENVFKSTVETVSGERPLLRTEPGKMIRVQGACALVAVASTSACQVRL